MQQQRLSLSSTLQYSSTDSPQRKRKLQSTADSTRMMPPPPTAVRSMPTWDCALLTAKKAKLEEFSSQIPSSTTRNESSETASEQQPQRTMLFKTPMKKPQLYINTNVPTIDATVLNAAGLVVRKSILDYISPNSKSAAKAESVKATTEAPEMQQIASAVADLPPAKRVSIRRSLSYSSEGDVLSDTSVASHDEHANLFATPTASALNDAECILNRLCGSHAAHNRSVALVGRTDEQAAIASVLNASEGVARSRSLFIIGPPGTGKSSSVNQLLGEYERHLPANAVVRLNCSSFTNPIALYAEVDEQLRRYSPWKLPYLDPCLLEEFLTDAACKRVACETYVLARLCGLARIWRERLTRCCCLYARVSCSVLVLDEVDQLLRLPPAAQKRVQDVLRFLVRWSALPAAKFTFLGIMNGLDMHTQLQAFLPHDVIVPHVLYPAYTFSELLAILTAQVDNAAGEAGVSASLVELRALELIARKVASRDGDVRRATTLLQQSARLCLRRSTEVGAESDAFHKISLRDVLACTTALLSAGPVRDVQQLPRLPKILLYAITIVSPSDSKPSDLEAVSQHLERLRAAPGFAWVPHFKRDELQAHLATLECYALVKRPARAASRNVWKAKLTSAITLDVVSRAVQDDPLLRTLPEC